MVPGWTEREARFAAWRRRDLLEGLARDGHLRFAPAASQAGWRAGTPIESAPESPSRGVRPLRNWRTWVGARSPRSPREGLT